MTIETIQIKFYFAILIEMYVECTKFINMCLILC